MGLNNNEAIYKQLRSKDKKLLNMYLTARQFNNAILEDEIVVIPSKAFNNREGSIEWASIKVAVRGNKTMVRVYPYVVNKAFACEVYLKLILSLEKDFNLRKIGHNIFTLFMKTNDDFKEEFYETFNKKYGEKVNEDYFQKEIENISNVFVDWRYIYEKTEMEMTVNYGFINVFCNYLDGYAKQKIFDKYGYDVDKDMR